MFRTSGLTNACLVLVGILVALPPLSRGETSSERQTTSQQPDDEDGICAFYLAPSSIPNAGFGVYTTKSVPKDSVVLPADSPSIVVTDAVLHQPDGEYPAWPQHNYRWGGDSWFEADDAEQNVMTFGSLANYHSGLANARPDLGSEEYDDGVLDRFKDAGAGAFSYHMGLDFRAWRDIESGEEIFLDYGAEYFDEIDERKSGMEDLPKREDFEKGDMVLEAVRENFKHVKKMTCDRGKDCESWADVEDLLLKTFNDIANAFSQRTASILPKSSSELAKIPEGKYGLAFSTVTRRSIDWIIENGQCLDNVVPGHSSLPQAGTGGFARRDISEGGLIVPAPLLQIVDSDTLTIYNSTIDRKTREEVRVKEEILGMQILLNYCFGHKESTMLLCPVSNAIVINHCSTRWPWEGECGEKGPNAAVRWASGWDPDTAEWLKFSLDDISGKHSGRGLSFEIYALRDIRQGEEIFMDYGADWEAAWERHIATWKPPAEGSIYRSYASTKELNGMPLRTLEEQKINPYPNNAMMVCHYWDTEEDVLHWENEDEDLVGDWTKLSNDELLDKYGFSGRHYVLSDMDNWEDSSFWPCMLYTQNEERGLVVRIFQKHTEDITPWSVKRLPRLLYNYPRESVKFVHKPYTSDQHLPGAFRHHIGIDDSLFPAQWKNIENNLTCQS